MSLINTPGLTHLEEVSILLNKIQAELAALRQEISIPTLERNQPPLFTTADGVKIYDPSTVVYVNVLLVFPGKPSVLSGIFAEELAKSVYDYPGTKLWRVYSTPEAAEKGYEAWLLEQPVLTGYDLFKWKDGANLSELIKSKLPKP
ncbi:hypothetical protein [Paraflavitalea speifideaquila]|uniref:hypothetical protein n=1 Tax=Paraflavitalea speifideaquila TaxID=3076558 RepID=UPI0028F13440|nr:hypothetical protein [Paraflavitalea speifideiaquila]